MSEFSIPLSEPTLQGNEWKYVKECIDGEWVSSSGKYVNLFEQKITEYTGAKFAIACVNGTSALQVSLRLAGVRSGDEVIVPTLTFIAPVNAIAYNGASPVFMDADEYYNIDIMKTIDFIQNQTYFKDNATYNKITNKRISAIIPVHIWGNAVWLDKLVPLCKKYNISVVEDACESLGTFYIKGLFEGKHTGTIGELGCLSFNGNKIITTGGGGMILTNDFDLANKAKYLTTQAKDDPVNYIHNEIGYNFRLTNIQAAIGVAQLEKIQNYLKRKKEIHKQYLTCVKEIKSFIIADIPNYANNNHWLNIFMRNPVKINKVIDYLRHKNIETRPIWQLNHLQEPYKSCQSYKVENAPKLINQSLCLPSSVSITDNQISIVINKLKKYFKIK